MKGAQDASFVEANTTFGAVGALGETQGHVTKIVSLAVATLLLGEGRDPS